MSEKCHELTPQMQASEMKLPPNDATLCAVNSCDGRSEANVKETNQIVELQSYLSPLHPLLHTPDTALHCATQDPDSPQLCAQEKLLELQFAMHSAKDRVCASRSFSIDVSALPGVTPNKSKENAATYVMLWPPQSNIARIKPD